MTSAALQLPNNNPRDYERLPKELWQEYAKLLKLYATDDFYSTVWHIHLNKANRTGNIRFLQSQTITRIRHHQNHRYHHAHIWHSPLLHVNAESTTSIPFSISLILKILIFTI